YKHKNSKCPEDDTFTLFGYACEQPGAEIKTGSFPRAAYNPKSNIELQRCDAHPGRSGSFNFGEMIQMDACQHNWSGTEQNRLHTAADDAIKIMAGAYFDKQETLNGYYNVFHQILTGYGIPSGFFTDRRTVFEYKHKNSKCPEDDTFTLFGYACEQPGAEIKTGSFPRAKGLVERVFGTLQGRLPFLLKQAGVTGLEQTNTFPNSCVKQYNANFALKSNNIPPVFEKQPLITVADSDK
ncbi:MAG: hypothetical protein LBD73_03200, partial [Deferribacteraceae bacterium]|nr:hypothetical protein [Deferribacteraceae bacterium]